METEDKEMEQNEKNIHTDGLLTVQQFAALVGKSPQSIYKRLNKVDNQGVNLIQPYVVVVDGQKMLKIQAISELYGIEVDNLFNQVVNLKAISCQPHSTRLNNLFNRVEENNEGEIIFLREQIRRQGDVIESLNRELEKEREHNRDKDRQLLNTLSKLAETQAALAAGQNAEKQKALAETLLEGQQMMDEECKEPLETAEIDFEEEFHDKPKNGFFQRIWALITNK